MRTRRIGYIVLEYPDWGGSMDPIVVSSGNTLYPTRERAIVDNANDFRRDENRFKVASVHVEEDDDDNA